MVIETETEYQTTLDRISLLMEFTTHEGCDPAYVKELNELADAVEAYEDIYYPFPPKD